MKRVSALLISLFVLTSCAPVRSAGAEPLTTVTPSSLAGAPEPTFTVVALSATATQVACDPRTADYCITAGHFILQHPLKLPANLSVDATYLYGSTENGTREPHHGVDISNPAGTPVYAAANGVVVFVGPDSKAIYSPWNNFYGNLVVIKHADDLYTLYAHLSKITVQAGKNVFVGDKIGEVGRTGVAIGSHLHFEVRRGDFQNYFSTDNPELWLVPNKDKNGNRFGVLTISVVDEKFHFHSAELTVKYYLDKSKSHVKSYYISTYAPDMANGEENAALGNLPPGHYRVALKDKDQLLERWVEVESGKLTQVVFVVK